MTELTSFDRVAHCYDDTRGLPGDIALRISRGLARIVRQVSKRPRVLEVGVGTGRIAVPLTAAGARILGTDIAPKMIARLREKSRDIDVVMAEASRPPLRDVSVDAAVFVHILHLVPDAEATVRATLPLVRRGGVMIMAGDDRLPGRAYEGHRIVERALREMTGTDIRLLTDHHDRAVEAFGRLLAEAGAFQEHVALAEWTDLERGSRFLERLERRDFSASWRIPEAVMPGLIERVAPQITTLYGGLDIDHEQPRSFSATVGRLPA